MPLMSNKKFEFSSLAGTYKDFSVPTVKVLVDGQNILASGDFRINGLKVELSSGMEASGCVFDVYNVFEESERTFKKDAIGKYFKLGKKIEIELGYIVSTKVFTGYISGLSFKVGEEIPTVTVEGTDAKGLMMNNLHNKQWTKQKYSDVVTDIFSDYSTFCSSKKIDATTEVKKKIEMVNESDYDFVVRLAEREGYEFFILEDTFYFRKPEPYKEPAITLEWGININNLEKRISLEGQVLELEVKGYDENKGVAIKGVAKSTVKMDTTAKAALKGLKKTITDSSIMSQEEANKLAASLLKKINRNYTELRAELVGLPEVVPGRFIAVTKLGGDVDGKYYVTRVTHSFSDENYTTFIEARNGD